MAKYIKQGTRTTRQAKRNGHDEDRTRSLGVSNTIVLAPRANQLRHTTLYSYDKYTIIDISFLDHVSRVMISSIVQSTSNFKTDRNSHDAPNELERLGRGMHRRFPVPNCDERHI